MMKKVILLLVIVLGMARMPILAQITGVYEIGLVAVGNNTLKVNMRCINPANPCPTTADAILDITFGIKWLNSYNVNLGNPSGTYGVVKSGPESVQGAHEFQIYQLNVAPLFFPQNWSSGTWQTIANINISPPVTGLFEICEPSFNPSSKPNFNVNGDDYEPAINGDANIVLPVELLAFDAFRQNDDVALEWSTASEINSSHFDVERSADGRNFQYLTKVQAAVFSSKILEYGCLDKNPLRGTNYYRLKQVDMDGSYEYSQIVTVDFGAKEDILLYPNPFSNILQIDIHSEQGELTAQLFDVAGRRVWQGMLQDGRQEVGLSGLQAGVFWLEVDFGNRTERVRVVKN